MVKIGKNWEKIVKKTGKTDFEQPLSNNYPRYKHVHTEPKHQNDVVAMLRLKVANWLV